MNFGKLETGKAKDDGQAMGDLPDEERTPNTKKDVLSRSCLFCGAKDDDPGVVISRCKASSFCRLKNVILVGSRLKETSKLSGKRTSR